MSEAKESPATVLALPANMKAMPAQRIQGGEVSPMAMLQIAVQRGDDIEKISKLMELAERMNANQARMAFTEAMAQFKLNPPTILKDKHVSYPNSKGGKTEYDHARLGTICAAIIEGLAAVGVSHRWTLAQGDGGRVTVTCILTHSQGHSESTSLSSSPDDSGGKNNIQAIGSITTYLQRYTLLAATGLATNDMPDDDGRGSEGPPAMMTAEHQATVQALCDEIKKGMAATVAKSYKATSLAEIPDSEFDSIIRRLQDAKKKSAEKAGAKS